MTTGLSELPRSASHRLYAEYLRSRVSYLEVQDGSDGEENSRQRRDKTVDAKGTDNTELQDHEVE